MTDTLDAFFMARAIAVAEEGLRKGNTPFGAVLVKEGKVVAEAHNRVWQDTDITAHAEIVLLRKACEALDSVSLSGTVLYSTCEPCPMCFSAIHWAAVDRVVYGARIEDAQELGFRELTLSTRRIKEQGGSDVEIRGPFMRDENLELFRHWADRTDGRRY